MNVMVPTINDRSRRWQQVVSAHCSRFDNRTMTSYKSTNGEPSRLRWRHDSSAPMGGFPTERTPKLPTPISIWFCGISNQSEWLVHIQNRCHSSEMRMLDTELLFIRIMWTHWWRDRSLWCWSNKSSMRTNSLSSLWLSLFLLFPIQYLFVYWRKTVVGVPVW